jgi:hypothetical protein
MVNCFSLFFLSSRIWIFFYSLKGTSHSGKIIDYNFVKAILKVQRTSWQVTFGRSGGQRHNLSNNKHFQLADDGQSSPV